MTRALSPESGSKKVMYINEPKFTIKAEVHLAESGGGPSHELANISQLLHKLY